MSKFRFKRSELEGVPDAYIEIVKLKDPIEFIDLLCANHYFAGQFNNKIPVQQARNTFLAWLKKHDDLVSGSKTPDKGGSDESI